MQCCAPFRKMKVIQVGENLLHCYATHEEARRLRNIEALSIFPVPDKIFLSITFQGLEVLKIPEDVKVNYVFYPPDYYWMEDEDILEGFPAYPTQKHKYID